MRWRRESILVGLVLFLALLAGAETNDVARLIKDLDRPFFRNFAFRELLELNGKPDPKAWVNHVVKCPQPDGTLLYAVFKSAGESLDQKMGASNGLAVGTAVLFDVQGQYVGLRTVPKGQVFRDINRDTVLEQVSVFSIMVSDFVPTVDTLFVDPVLRTDELCLNRTNVPLIVAFNHEYEISQWYSAVEDTDGDGLEEVHFGPRNPQTGKLEPNATYTWSPKDKAWHGPKGGLDQHFMRLSPEKRRADLAAFYRARTKVREEIEANRSRDGSQGAPLTQPDEAR